MIKIVGKTIEIGAQFSSAGFGGIDRISPCHSGLGRSCLPEKDDRFVMEVRSKFVGCHDDDANRRLRLLYGRGGDR